jgi:hypothetical protein
LHDDAFFRVAPGFLAGGGDALFAQDVHGVVEVAGGFHKRLLAVHQTCAGHFAEFADVRCGNVSHSFLS